MTTASETYDIALADGQVIAPEIYLDRKMRVGIHRETIADVSDVPLKGKEIIDATGMIRRPSTGTRAKVVPLAGLTHFHLKPGISLRDRHWS